MNVLIIDDEKSLANAIAAILAMHNIDADCRYDGESGLDAAFTDRYDAVILDVMLPKKDGYEVISTLRSNGVSTPVLMLSAKSQTEDKIKGLDLGADDYLAKPFEADELVARVKALLRRKEKFIGDVLAFGDISFDDCGSLICKGRSIPVGKKEYRIMELLIRSQGRPVEKDKIIEKIWGFDSDAEYNATEVYISFLRKKLAALSSKTNIKSLRGLGYILEYSE